MESVKEEKKRGKPVLRNLVILITVVVIAALVIIWVILATTSANGQNPAVSPQDCSNRVIQYVNQNLVQAGTSATLINSSEDHGLYGVIIQYQGQQMTLYALRIAVSSSLIVII